MNNYNKANSLRILDKRIGDLVKTIVPEISFGGKGWKGYLSDTGSKNYNKSVTVHDDFLPIKTTKRCVMFEDGTIENTDRRLLKETSDTGRDTVFNVDDRVICDYPDSKYHTCRGVIVGIVDFLGGKGMLVKWDDTRLGQDVQQTKFLSKQ